jgi:hypothetical protein
MKLSSETVTLLKNFSTINSGLKFRKGNKLSTMSQTKSILVEATVAENFPQDFCVYDLTQFLSFQNMYSNGELDIDDKNVTFKDGRRSSTYRLTSENQIVVPPQKTLTLPSVDVEFYLSEEDLAWLMKSAAISQSPNVAVESDGQTMTLTTFDASDDSAHTNSCEVQDGNGQSYKLVFKTENLKLIPGAYDVKISSKGISHFVNNKLDLQYWIAIEATTSRFGE